MFIWLFISPDTGGIVTRFKQAVLFNKKIRINTNMKIFLLISLSKWLKGSNLLNQFAVKEPLYGLKGAVFPKGISISTNGNALKSPATI